MKKFRLFLFLVFAAVFSCGFVAGDSRKAIAEKLYGDIYVEKRAPGLADYSVYVEKRAPGFADLTVYIEKRSGFANSPGVWHYVESRGRADYSVYFEKRAPGFADLTVYFTDTPGRAGPR